METTTTPKNLGQIHHGAVESSAQIAIGSPY